MKLTVIEWFKDDDIIERKIFGPFASHQEAAEFGESCLQTEQTSEQLDCSVGWSVENLLSP